MGHNGFASLEAWVSGTTGERLGVELRDDINAHSRCLVLRSPIQAGCSAASIPWSCAITPQSALEDLHKMERLGASMLSITVEQLTQLLEEGDEDVAPVTGWVTLLALGLLSSMRNPRSPLMPYLAMLPAPEGSRLAAVCRHGPAATDLMFFSASELSELQNPPLVVAVQQERRRLTRLHRKLIKLEGSEALVSLESFLWAHALVRSRALDLTASAPLPISPVPAISRTLADDDHMGGLFRARCLLPVIDLCNHSPAAGFCLSVRMTSEGRPRAVDLVANMDMEEGEEATLDYGSRPLRDMLRGYGFVPQDAAANAPYEVYEDLGSSRQALVVRGSPHGHTFRLTEIRVLHVSGDDPALELNRASVVYLVQDDASALHPGDAPCVKIVPGTLPHATSRISSGTTDVESPGANRLSADELSASASSRNESHGNGHEGGEAHGTDDGRRGPFGHSPAINVRLLPGRGDSGMCANGSGLHEPHVGADTEVTSVASVMKPGNQRTHDGGDGSCGPHMGADGVDTGLVGRGRPADGHRHITGSGGHHQSHGTTHGQITGSGGGDGSHGAHMGVDGGFVADVAARGSGNGSQLEGEAGCSGGLNKHVDHSIRSHGPHMGADVGLGPGMATCKSCNQRQWETEAEAGGACLVRPMDPEQEFRVVQCLAAECETLLASWPTSIADDQRVLAALGRPRGASDDSSDESFAHQISIDETLLARQSRPCEGSDRASDDSSAHQILSNIGSHQIHDSCSKARMYESLGTAHKPIGACNKASHPVDKPCDLLGGAQGSQPGKDKDATGEGDGASGVRVNVHHLSLAVEYRLQRKLLLQRVIEGLAAQACLVGPST